MLFAVISHAHAQVWLEFSGRMQTKARRRRSDHGEEPEPARRLTVDLLSGRQVSASAGSPNAPKRISVRSEKDNVKEVLTKFEIKKFGGVRPGSRRPGSRSPRNGARGQLGRGTYFNM